MVPMIEPTAWPPSAGAPSTSTTVRPSLAASSAADTPAMPAPNTQMSAVTVCTWWRAGRRTMRVPGRSAAMGLDYIGGVPHPNVAFGQTVVTARGFLATGV